MKKILILLLLIIAVSGFGQSITPTNSGTQGAIIAGSGTDILQSTTDHLVCHIPMITKYAAGQTVLDVTAYNNHAPASGNPVIGSDDTTFDGTDAFTIPSSYNDTFKGDFSICIKLKPDDGHPSGNQYIYGDWVDATGKQALLLLTSGIARFLFYGGSGSVYFDTNSAIFIDGTTPWTHLTITGNQATHEFKLYINDILEPITTFGAISSANWVLYNSTTNEYFLGDKDVGGNYVGKQKGYRLYNRIISTDEMLQVMAEDE